jgi:hypothetical protein
MTREVHALSLDDTAYRDLVVLSEDSGRGINGEIAVAVNKHISDNLVRLDRIVKDKLVAENKANKEAQRRYDEGLVAHAHFETDAVKAARARLAK